MSNIPVATRRSSNYSFAQHGAGVGRAQAGNYIVKNNAAEIVRPAWGKGTKRDSNGLTTIRLLPVLKRPENPAEHPTWTPYRWSATNPNDFGDWIRRYYVANGVGTSGNAATFIVAEPTEGGVVDISPYPLSILHRAVKQAVDNKTDPGGWAGYLKGSAGKRAELEAPKFCYFLQVMLVHKDGTDFMQPPKGLNNDLQLLMLTESAGRALVEEINRTKEGTMATADDYENYYAAGDPIAINKGAYFTFYKESDGDPRVAQTTAPAVGFSMGGRGGMGGNQQGSDGVSSYACFSEKFFKQTVPADLSAFEAKLAATSRDWDDVLYFPSMEEQAEYLATRFPASMLGYAFQDYPHFVTDTLRAKLVNRVVSVGAGATAPAGHPGFAAGYVPPAPDAFSQGSFMPTNPPVTSFGGVGQPPTQAYVPPAPPAAPPGYMSAAAIPQPTHIPVASPASFGPAPTEVPAQTAPVASPAMSAAAVPSFAMPTQGAAYLPPPVVVPATVPQEGVPFVPGQTTFGAPPVANTSFGPPPVANTGFGPPPGVGAQAPGGFVVPTAPIETQAATSRGQAALAAVLKASGTA